jgi:hypothetical protein
MLGTDHTNAEIARQRRVAALQEGHNSRLAREARLHRAATGSARAPTPTRRSVLVGWWHGLAR